MKAIGIIANPASGKDIRRLVSHATVIDNHEKINIVERIILGAQQCGVERVFLMPDSFQIGYRAIDNLKNTGELHCRAEVLNMKIQAGLKDTIGAAGQMEAMGLGCIVVLGGDGTNRGVAKAIGETPLISISTGTNNVYPEMIEGTVAGMAAAVAASGSFSRAQLCRREKRIEIWKENQLVDLALVDAVICKNVYAGSKALWHLEDIDVILASRSHPASIGFSAIVGCKQLVRPQDEYGVRVALNRGPHRLVAPMAAGLVKPVQMEDPHLLSLGEAWVYKAPDFGMVALDGERELSFRAGETLLFRLERKGPYRVDIGKALEIAQEAGFFMRSCS